MSDLSELYTCPLCVKPNFTRQGLRAHVCKKKGANGLGKPLDKEEWQAVIDGHYPEFTRERAARSEPPDLKLAKAKSLKISKAIVPAAKPVTLEVLDAMPATPQRHVLLGEMTVEQLHVAFTGLERVRETSDSTSGVCATLAGLVLTEVKKKLPHGEYLPWVERQLGKKRNVAALYVRVAASFSKSKCITRDTFGQFTLALMDGPSSELGPSLDITHPVVGAVTKWTKGRSFRQLIEDELKNGGNNHAKCPHCDGDLKSKDQEICPHCGKETGEKEPSPEELKAQLTETVREWANEHLTDDRIERKLYRLLPDHEAAALASHFRRAAQEIDEWVKTPAKRRDEMAIEEVLQ